MISYQKNRRQKGSDYKIVVMIYVFFNYNVVKMKSKELITLLENDFFKGFIKSTLHEHAH